MPATTLDSQIFSDLFTTSEMRAIFSDETRVAFYLEIEAALARAEAGLGVIPQDAAREIVAKCRIETIDLAKLKEQTDRAGSPIIGLVAQIVAACADGHGEWAHWGATTQDITDTATVMQIRDALALVERDIDAIAAALKALAVKHRDLPMAGRSKLQQAVPITFGYKCATYLAAMQRHRERLREFKARVLVGEFGGAVGTLASLGKDGLKVQAALMKELKLGEPDITWHTLRDRFGEVGAFLALLTATCAKIATDVKLLMQTEVGEVREGFAAGRGTSSTMPQKRNPVSSPLIHTGASLVRHNANALLEAAVGDHERMTGPWEIEWIAIPEIFLLTSGVLRHTRELTEGLEVDAVQMLRNLALTKGLIVSEAVMMGLGPHLGRQHAHHLVADICREVVRSGVPLIELLTSNKEIAKVMSRAELEKLVDPANYVGVAGEMVDRVVAKEKP
ncbi:3-carboxy-cis,cis-muconate cycloisomerase [Variibacter gotjawalensis]|uniref:3-carboxy-cis,cis-muconate cycloisomerase n=1 Tax=Variibacter gotjawalensis TaxID=1333996 RepID=A0A0S3PZA6_9BRAD|nr:3-carboxy-cis,cis-muconate cycloisomerase [Variibacter gotjawalensis]NIK47081.1 3-carboxy-cis,cis-muconate cycloisomerase [Variibacter gotjawalensis]RZS48983.1 3-carboxy-cis,cis-muconate cycloisomerase [Variibacter gotjawalensis]BAT61243.1 3-carboxy-cis,cis-muconate cycloisomerase [Variibacter gotjawalensis]